MVLKSLARVPDLPPLIRLMHLRIHRNTGLTFSHIVLIELRRSAWNPTIGGGRENVHNRPDPQQILYIVAQLRKRFIQTPRNRPRHLVHGAEDPTRGRKLDDTTIDVAAACAIWSWVGDARADLSDFGVEVGNDGCAAVVDVSHAFENPPQHVICEHFVWPDRSTEQIWQPAQCFFDVACRALSDKAEGLAAKIVVDAGEPDLLDDCVWRLFVGKYEAGLKCP